MQRILNAQLVMSNKVLACTKISNRMHQKTLRMSQKKRNKMPDAEEEKEKRIKGGEKNNYKEAL